jgi:type I restriction enzyme S subunit
MAQPKLNQKKLSEIPIHIPNESNQRNIFRDFRRLNIQSASLESVYKQKLMSLNELKQSLLQKAFSGELTKDIVDEIAEAAE